VVDEKAYALAKEKKLVLIKEQAYRALAGFKVTTSIWSSIR
jgi:hypothetical protein